MNGPSPEPLLEAAKYFLSHRKLDNCRNYALRAQQSDPHHPGAAQILAVSDTLTASETPISGTLPDWYAVLQISRYSGNSQLIKLQFKKLTLLLHPSENKFPFADEAFKLVYNAWSVLSDSFKKSQFDNELTIFESKANDTFWTSCPYCYYVYEYARVYQDCCLRCQNEKCRRGLHAVAINSPPPLEVVESGKYCCMGFFPLGFDDCERKGVSSWIPFSQLVMVNENVEKNNDVGGGDNECNKEGFIEISDGSEDSNNEFVSKSEVTYVNGNGQEVETEKVQQNDEYVGKPVMNKRKKSVPKNAKKLMGKGTKIGRNDIVGQSVERLDLNAEAGVDDADNGHGSGGVGVEMGSGGDFVMSDVEFFTGDDDIFVGFPDCF